MRLWRRLLLRLRRGGEVVGGSVDDGWRSGRLVGVVGGW